MNGHRLLEGYVHHQRLEPKVHRFRYRLFQFYLDLDHINELSHISPFLSVERINYISFYRKDYFNNPWPDLKHAVLQHIGIKSEHGQYKVFMVTNLSFLGFCFNPISLYLIFKNNAFHSMIAEVTNTPWHERHLYVLDTPTRHTPPIFHFRAKKQLHVSPFMSMDYEYHFKLKLNENVMILHIDNLQNGVRKFDATLSMQSIPFTRSNFHTISKRYPLQTHKIVALIHWHALRLWLKGVPFHSHPKNS